MSSGGCGTHMAIRSAHDLCACMRRAQVSAVVSDGEAEKSRVSTRVLGDESRASTSVRYRWLLRLGGGFLLLGMLPWDLKDLLPPLSCAHQGVSHRLVSARQESESCAYG